jgi:insertion element IS1 protein InsB
MKCKYCSGVCKKKGWYTSIQKYQCKNCLRYQRESYVYQKISEQQYSQIIVFHKEGLGIRSISRILNIAITSVQRSISVLGEKYTPVMYDERYQEYEVDELWTFVNSNIPSNYRYIAYAINRRTRKVIDFVIGRSKEKLRPLIDKLLSFSPSKIFTDGLAVYDSLIPKKIHYSYEHCINHIERNNLTLRIRLKRLNRKTICYSRSEKMLESSLKLYFLAS